LSATVGRVFLLYRAKPVSRAVPTVINLSLLLTLTSDYALEIRRLQKRTTKNSSFFIERLQLFFAVSNRVFVSFLHGFFNAKTLLGVWCPFFAASKS